MGETFFSKQRLVALLEALAVLMLLLLLSKPFFETTVFAAIDAAVSLAYILPLFFAGKKAFGKEFNAHLLFFLFLLFAVQAAIITQAVFPENIEVQGFSFAAIVAAMACFAVFFKARFGKSHCTGKVIAVKGKETLVETEFDFLASAKKNVYRIETSRKLKKGQEVRVRLKNLLWKTKAEITD